MSTSNRTPARAASRGGKPAPTPRSRSGVKRSSSARVSRDVRRQQLLAVAARILTEHGIDQVQITEVAERAGVSRPLVYRLFPTRNALVQALLSDFVQRLGERFQAALLSSGTRDNNTHAFIDACCSAIEEQGAGPWLLLDARADAELGRIGQKFLDQLITPWRKGLADFTGLPPHRASNALWIIVAAGRAALDGWITGRISRRTAAEDATRAVNALLLAFVQTSAG